MQRKPSIFTLLIGFTVLLAACRPTGVPGSVPAAPILPTLPTPAKATVPAVLPSATPTLFPTLTVGDLTVTVVEMQEPPEVEPMLFTSVQGRKFSSQDFSLGDTRFADSSFFNGSDYCMKNELDGAALLACQHYTPDGALSWVDLSSDGREIYRIDTGSPDPTNHLQGLWVYDHHWALETVNVIPRQPRNEVSSDLVRQISIDGVLLNEREKYAEPFGFQTLGGKPFFLFERDGKIGFVYDGAENLLDFDAVPHYGCCSAAVINPQAWLNHTTFFARRSADWFFVTVS